MKSYVKPDLYYEDFELSHNVASCSIDGDNTKGHATAVDKDICEYNLGGMIIFSGAHCEWQEADLGLEGYCYQTAADGYTFFRS